MVPAFIDEALLVLDYVAVPTVIGWLSDESPSLKDGSTNHWGSVAMIFSSSPA